MKETIIQFGTGNFLRGFADYFIHILHEKGLYDGKITVVSPTDSKTVDILNAQNCRYNLYLRGIKDGTEIHKHTEIHSISRAINPYKDFAGFLSLAENPDFRFIISNTTEAGIKYVPENRFDDKPASSFPAKLTQLLYARYKSGLSGFVIFACELIENNAKQLKNCVLRYAEQWNLGDAFALWIDNENTFCNTLVDRIVTGYPHDEAEELCKKIGYSDKLLNTGEIYHLWVIEGDFEHEIPLRKAGLNVIWTKDVLPYKKRKVRVLNGAHTSIVFPALLRGLETVEDCMEDEQICAFLRECLYKYILPVIGESEENTAFADSVLERFKNPYIKHRLQSIALNSVSKFAVRVLPTAIAYKRQHSVYPKPLVFSLAALIEYYKTSLPQDDEKAVSLIRENDYDVILASESLWGMDLSAMLPMFKICTEKIHKYGIREAIKWALS